MKESNFFAVMKSYQRLVSAEGRRLMRAMLILATCAGVIEGLSLFSVLTATTALATGQSAVGLPLFGWIAVLGTLAIIGFIVSDRMALVSYRASLDVMRHSHNVLGDQIARLPLGWFTERIMGRMSQLASGGMMTVGQVFAHMATRVISSMAGICTVVIGLWIWKPALALIVTIAIPIYYVIVQLCSEVQARAKLKAEPVRAELADRIVEYSRCQPALRASGRSVDLPHLQSAIEADMVTSRRMLWIEVGCNLISGVAGQTIIVMLIMAAGRMSSQGLLGPLETIAFIGVCLRLLQNIAAVGEMMAGLQEQKPVMRTISHVLDSPVLPEPTVSVMPVADAGVEFENVSFSYVDGAPVLSDVSFSVKPHTMTALVGPSGSGKTTIARLISRFYDVDSGCVRVGGVDVRELTTTDLMAQLSMIFQDVYLFNDSLIENIRVGNPRASDEEIHAAAEIAGVSEIVRRLPQGWDSRVGEGGILLSGGERQRVSIARAILKHSPIVVVDEATSALDAENESHIADSLSRLRQEATVIAIAHRLETIQKADQIIVLSDKGRVVQLGTHDELVNQPGIYQGYWSRREQVIGWDLTHLR